VYPTPDQKDIRIAQLLVDEILGVPEAILFNHGTNMLANVVQDVCQLLGITNLNTTTSLPQCDGMVERFNRMLKTMLRKHAVKFNNQWYHYLPGILWVYQNTPHEVTKEKYSTTAGLPVKQPHWRHIVTLILGRTGKKLSSVRELADQESTRILQAAVQSSRHIPLKAMT